MSILYQFISRSLGHPMLRIYQKSRSITFLTCITRVAVQFDDGGSVSILSNHRSLRSRQTDILSYCNYIKRKKEIQKSEGCLPPNSGNTKIIIKVKRNLTLL